MKFAPLFCCLLYLSAAAEPVKKEPVPTRPVSLPVIEIHSETPSNTTAPAAGNSTYDLPAIEGQKAQKMSGGGRAYWGGAYGMPNGPGRAWPAGNAPGTPGAAPGAVMNPTGFPGRF
ncbi:MAG: hypothetical protein J0I12_22145 [Candidatus Eremiobacteraeota bacterium]|nr:hypothetical protein [Candidatus Eremiobacteraeota bacterium]